MTEDFSPIDAVYPESRDPEASVCHYTGGRAHDKVCFSAAESMSVVPRRETGPLLAWWPVSRE